MKKLKILLVVTIIIGGLIFTIQHSLEEQKLYREQQKIEFSESREFVKQTEKKIQSVINELELEKNGTTKKVYFRKY